MTALVPIYLTWADKFCSPWPFMRHVEASHNLTNARLFSFPIHGQSSGRTVAFLDTLGPPKSGKNTQEHRGRLLQSLSSYFSSNYPSSFAFSVHYCITFSPSSLLFLGCRVLFFSKASPSLLSLALSSAFELSLQIEKE